MKNLIPHIQKVIAEEIEKTKKQPFTKEEEKIMDFIVEAHNIFAGLEKTHPSEEQDWANAIHILQRLMGQRVLRRDYPDYFYSGK